jgi:hypothetical protein
MPGSMLSLSSSLSRPNWNECAAQGWVFSRVRDLARTALLCAREIPLGFARGRLLLRLKSGYAQDDEVGMDKVIEKSSK